MGCRCHQELCPVVLWRDSPKSSFLSKGSSRTIFWVQGLEPLTPYDRTSDAQARPANATHLHLRDVHRPSALCHKKHWWTENTCVKPTLGLTSHWEQISQLRSEGDKMYKCQHFKLQIKRYMLLHSYSDRTLKWKLLSSTFQWCCLI